jgi:hypothetical protein
MIDICETCIEISCIDLTYELGDPRPAWIKQCSDCGLWWEHRFSRYLGWGIYAPIECQQRRCLEHARHKVKARGKRKYKCDRHAGVCIIA